MGKKLAYFLDFKFETEGNTFFPRPETELLVEKAVELLLKKNMDLPCRILDIGTGCGNIAISLTNYIPSSRIVALDISDTALRITKENAVRYGVLDKIEFVISNLFESLEENYKNYFDLIISNPPYISLDDFYLLSKEVKDDPYVALYGGKDGLNFYREIIKKSPLYLKRDGILLMEIGYGQAANIKNMLEKVDTFYNIEFYKDYSGIDRIAKANACLKSKIKMTMQNVKWIS